MIFIKENKYLDNVKLWFLSFIEFHQKKWSFVTIWRYVHQGFQGLELG